MDSFLLHYSNSWISFASERQNFHRKVNQTLLDRSSGKLVNFCIAAMNLLLYSHFLTKTSWNSSVSALALGRLTTFIEIDTVFHDCWQSRWHRLTPLHVEMRSMFLHQSSRTRCVAKCHRCSSGQRVPRILFLLKVCLAKKFFTMLKTLTLHVLKGVHEVGILPWLW